MLSRATDLISSTPRYGKAQLSNIVSEIHVPTSEMADVDMPDAGPSVPAKGKATVKSSKSGAADGGLDGKKRFEVKKVRHQHDVHLDMLANCFVVECCSFMGVGHRCRQLCHLQKPYYGPLLVALKVG